MNILITGASGFIGKNLLRNIKIENQYSKDKIILLTKDNIEGYLCIQHNEYTFIKDDFVKLGIYEIDIVVHLGAFIPKNSQEANDIDKSFSNIRNTIYLLNNLPNTPKKIIFASTIDVYKNTSDIIDENTDIFPSSLYGWSKLMCEKIIENYAIQSNSIVQILRIGHIYGIGEETYKKLIPVTIRKIISNESPEITSNKKELRSFLHVDDCSKSIIKSTELNTYTGPINLTSSNKISVLELINLLIRISNKKISIIINENKKEKRNLVFSNDKMNQYLCQESISLEKGLYEEYKYMLSKKV